jgi:RNA polymerase sigma-70 factor (ECF subfamily)
MKTTFVNEDLADEALSGNLIALHAILHLVQPRLVEYCRRHLPPTLRSVIEPEDIVQDVCVEAFRRLGEFTPDGEADAMYRWLVTIARHRMIDQLRAQKAAKRGGSRRQISSGACDDDSGILALLGSLAVHYRTPSRSAAAHELAIALDQSIDGLPPDYRQAIRLRHIEGLAAKDAAARMNRTEGAFHLLCNRGLKQLRLTLRSRSIFV